MQIHDKSILVKLSIGLPGNTRKDPKLTGDVQREHKLSEKSGRWLKQLYPDEALDPLHKLVTEARAWHYLHSLPWADEGWRILPTEHYFEYAEMMRSYRERFEDLSQAHFLAKYDDWVAWALQAHNGTMDHRDYPGAEAVKHKFAFKVDHQPVPCGADFRVQFAAEEMDSLRQQVDSRVALAAEEARKDLWQRLIEPVRNMVERLKDPKATFRDTLVGNLREIVGLIPALNVTEDQTLIAFRAEVQQELCKHGPDTLRDSPPTRSEVAAKAAAILSRMEGYGK